MAAEITATTPGVYAGIDGVVRKCDGTDMNRSFVRHAREAYVCVDGVVRPVFDLLDDVDHIEISFDDVTVYSMTQNSSGGYDVNVIGKELACLDNVGSIDFTDNSVQVTCTTALRIIDVRASVYVVHRDGFRNPFYRFDQDDAFAFGVGYYLYFSGNGGYVTEFLGNTVYSGHVSGSASGSTTVSPLAGNSDVIISSLRHASGTTRNRQTYNGCTIGGKSIPIVVTNNLT